MLHEIVSSQDSWLTNDGGCAHHKQKQLCRKQAGDLSHGLSGKKADKMEANKGEEDVGDMMQIRVQAVCPIEDEESKMQGLDQTPVAPMGLRDLCKVDVALDKGAAE